MKELRVDIKKGTIEVIDSIGLSVESWNKGPMSGIEDYSYEIGEECDYLVADFKRHG